METIFRNITEEDYEYVITNINEWWGGRQMSDMLPRLFFKYFNDTSFVAEVNGQIAGFIIGFFSQMDYRDSYVHFVGVHPEHRKNKIGMQLYDIFSQRAKDGGAEKVYCVTSPVNTNSVAFHQKIGFDILQGDQQTPDGISVFSNYDGKGGERVLFVKHL